MKKRGNQILFSNKHGQFYLISAIIIATFVIGLVAVSNYVQRDSSERIYNLREEVKIESAMVADYSLNRDQSETNFREVMSNFTDNYIKQYRNNKDIYFLFGSKNNMTVKGYQNVDRTIILSNGQNNVTVTSSEGSFSRSIDPDGSDEIILYLDELEYSFDLKTDINFNFILSERTSGGEYIITG